MKPDAKVDKKVHFTNFQHTADNGDNNIVIRLNRMLYAINKKLIIEVDNKQENS